MASNKKDNDIEEDENANNINNNLNNRTIPLLDGQHFSRLFGLNPNMYKENVQHASVQ